MHHNYGCCEMSIAIHRQHSSLQLVAVNIIASDFITYDIFLPLRNINKPHKDNNR